MLRLRALYQHYGDWTGFASTLHSALAVIQDRNKKVLKRMWDGVVWYQIENSCESY